MYTWLVFAHLHISYKLSICSGNTFSQGKQVQRNISILPNKFDADLNEFRKTTLFSHVRHGAADKFPIKNMTTAVTGNSSSPRETAASESEPKYTFESCSCRVISDCFPSFACGRALRPLETSWRKAGAKKGPSTTESDWSLAVRLFAKPISSGANPEQL